jgi:hypothetical protein
MTVSKANVERACPCCVPLSSVLTTCSNRSCEVSVVYCDLIECLFKKTLRGNTQSQATVCSIVIRVVVIVYRCEWAMQGNVNVKSAVINQIVYLC